jgi:hypothetical protein
VKVEDKARDAAGGVRQATEDDGLEVSG